MKLHFLPISFIILASVKGFGPGIMNELLSWETTTEFNTGLDFAFLGGRVSGTFDWYTKIIQRSAYGYEIIIRTRFL